MGRVDDKSAQGLPVSQCSAVHCSENFEKLQVATEVTGCGLLLVDADFRRASVRLCRRTTNVFGEARMAGRGLAYSRARTESN